MPRLYMMTHEATLIFFTDGAEILTLPGERYAASGEYWRSKYLCMVPQPVSPFANPVEILTLPNERDTTTGMYWRSKSPCLAPQPVRPEIAVSYE